MRSVRAGGYGLTTARHSPVSAPNGGSAAMSEGHLDASDLREYRYG